MLCCLLSVWWVDWWTHFERDAPRGKSDKRMLTHFELSEFQLPTCSNMFQQLQRLKIKGLRVLNGLVGPVGSRSKNQMGQAQPRSMPRSQTTSLKRSKSWPGQRENHLYHLLYSNPKENTVTLLRRMCQTLVVSSAALQWLMYGQQGRQTVSNPFCKKIHRAMH